MEPVTLVVIYRISFVLAAVIFALLGYLLLSGGTRLREGDVEFRLGPLRAKAVKAT